MAPDNLEARAVAVRTPTGDAEWTLTAERVGWDWRIRLASSEREWIGFGPDCFKAQRDLRTRLDVAGVHLGIHGARPNSWSSGMQCDMGEGLMTYLTELGVRGRPLQVRTLGPAPLDEVGTVAAQDEFHSRWLAERAPDR